MKKKSFGTHEIAQICQVTPPTIWRWINDGKLPCFKTLGGHRKVWDTDLVVFLKEQNIPVPDQIRYLGIDKILVVDDEDEVRSVVKRYLKKICPEAEIEAAADGFEAGHKVSQWMPSLVILDLKLPGMDGLKVCKIIRSDPLLKNIKILGISGQNSEESKDKSLRAGMDDFLAKPFDMNQLREKIVRLLKFGL